MLGAVCVLTAVLLITVINRRAFGWQIDFHITAEQFVNAFAVAMIAALAAGVYPAWRMARARVPADIWSLPSTAGRPATEVLAAADLAELLASVAPPAGLSTPSTSWRSPGAILEAQPAQEAYDVSRTSV